jgi:hypothetical protein
MSIDTTTPFSYFTYAGSYTIDNTDIVPYSLIYNYESIYYFDINAPTVNSTYSVPITINDTCGDLVFNYASSAVYNTTALPSCLIFTPLTATNTFSGCSLANANTYSV